MKNNKIHKYKKKRLKSAKNFEQSINNVGDKLNNFATSLISKFKFSISFRISVNYLLLMLKGIFSILLVIIGLYLYVVVLPLTKESHSEINKIINIIGDENALKNHMIKKNTSSNINIAIYNKDNKRIYTNNENETLEKFSYKILSKIPNKNEIIYISQKKIENNEKIYIQTYQKVNEEVYNLLYLSMIIIGVELLRIINITKKGAKLNKKVLMPIKDMTVTANSITANNLNLRLNVEDAKDELKDLAKTFNDMVERIETSYNNQKQFVSDASHELRTPIAVIQGYINMLDRWGKNDNEVLDEGIEAIKNEANNMKDLVEKLLFLARHDKKTLLYEKEYFDLDELIDEMVKETKMINTNHLIKSDIKVPANIYGDKNRIKQAIRIFIDNGCKYTQAGGTIQIETYIEGKYVVISVKDTGDGISRENLPKIFDRFYRADNINKIDGHGLGLSIAKLIILGHEGKIKVKSKEQEGSEFKVYLIKS